MNQNSVKNANFSLVSVFGRVLLTLIAVFLFCGDVFAQDYQVTMNPRRLGDQLGVEI